MLDKRTLCSGVVRISVGPNAAPFDAHLKLLSDCSTYFNAVFEKRLWSMHVILDDEDPDLFAEFLRWAYCGEIFEEATPSWMQLCQLWLLAEKLDVPKLQNLVMDHCQRRYAEVGWDDTDTSALMVASTVQFVYLNTAVGSPLRRIAVDSWRTVGGKVLFESVGKNFPREFVEDLWLRFFEYKHAGSWRGVTPPSTGDESCPSSLA